MGGCKPGPGSNSTAEIRNEDGFKDVTDIILTLVLDCLFWSENFCFINSRMLPGFESGFIKALAKRLASTWNPFAFDNVLVISERNSTHNRSQYFSCFNSCIYLYRHYKILL